MRRIFIVFIGVGLLLSVFVRSSLWSQGTVHGNTNAFQILPQNPHNGSVITFAIDPQGCFIASGGDDQTVKVWHLKSGKLFRTLLGHTDAVTCLAFDPTGRYLVSGSRNGIIWDIKTGDSLRVLKKRDSGSFMPMRADGVYIDPTGHYVAFYDRSGDRKMRLFNFR